MSGNQRAYLYVSIVSLLLVSAAALPISPSDWWDDGDISEESTVEISTGADTGSNSSTYGLLSRWEYDYRGQARWDKYDYDFDGDGVETKEQCGNCHMDSDNSSQNNDKHSPPLHPIAIEANITEGGDPYSNVAGGTSGWSGQWFYDDDNHRGPNTRLAAAYAGIRPNASQIECGACHTATDPSTAYGPEITSSDQFTNDPHSVHRDVMTREGCIRCHAYDNTSFYADDPATAGFQQNTLVFTQGNATRGTFGIANPINMYRVWDYGTHNGPVFLSTVDEANYSYSAGGTGLTTSGNGWAVYGNAETSRSSQYSCTDCHDQFHAEQGFGPTGGYGYEFAFNESPGSRKGPYAPVEDNESFGVMVGGRNVTCGVCHPSDAHAVHTNGEIVSRASMSQVQNASNQEILDQDGSGPPYEFNGKILGAELCDQCHSQNVGPTGPVHFQDPDMRGLAGNHQQWDSTHNRYPDLESSSRGWGDAEDCGFCHRIGSNDQNLLR